ncbi:ankyrin repeat domain-containing protein [Parvularcula sp. ZS-1/3]|uniref:Ankyrin repeat domain-containing protein n=1 Tax=Parvularcula mediterranea TaxID=2732508 RepID=A0A7Y3RMH3_9PROT|nr:ankyrin repeat domain-containing protein [Parvularcula mediterranea]NNU16817.1 ankyrin repeat domain-containing protein [Parvularcula mediterranea]
MSEEPHPLRSAIDAGSADALHAALRGNPDAANRPIACGEGHAVVPIHAICDCIFDGRISDERGTALVRVLLDEGAAANPPPVPSGDSLLITAISLGAPAIAHMLLDCGASADARGLFDASAIYWAAIMGMATIVERLLPSDELARRDTEFACTPLGWAVEGTLSPPRGSKGEAPRCAALLVAAGSEVEDVWRQSAKVRAHQDLSQALGL